MRVATTLSAWPLLPLRAGRRAFVPPERWAGLIIAEEDDLPLMTRTIPAFIGLGPVIAAGGFGLLLLVTR
ncbi:hypothetical protein [Actinoplanes sp. NPDC026619]|uniref:hypothetical protein n=1 Tax=Actinoplanes sp. NPDC026619 TaxID=3155798 RepID=UPI00340DDB05